MLIEGRHAVRLRPHFTQPASRSSCSAAQSVLSVPAALSTGTRMTSMTCSRRLPELRNGSMNTLRQLLRRTGTVVVQEDNRRIGTGHVVVNRDHVNSVGAERLQDGGHFPGEHRYVP